MPCSARCSWSLHTARRPFGSGPPGNVGRCPMPSRSVRRSRPKREQRSSVEPHWTAPVRRLGGTASPRRFLVQTPPSDPVRRPGDFSDSLWRKAVRSVVPGRRQKLERCPPQQTFPAPGAWSRRSANPSGSPNRNCPRYAGPLDGPSAGRGARQRGAALRCRPAARGAPGGATGSRADGRPGRPGPVRRAVGGNHEGDPGDGWHLGRPALNPVRGRSVRATDRGTFPQIVSEPV